MDVEKGKDTSVLGNGNEEDVEKDDQGWLLDGQPTWEMLMMKKMLRRTTRAGFWMGNQPGKC